LYKNVMSSASFIEPIDSDAAFTGKSALASALL